MKIIIRDVTKYSKKSQNLNNSFLGDFNWNDVTRQAYWQIKMDKFDVQGTNVTACDQSDGCQVIIDSGTSLLGMILRDFQEKNYCF